MGSVRVLRLTRSPGPVRVRLTFQPKLTGDAADDEVDTVSSWTLTPVTLAYSGTLDLDTIDKTDYLDFSDVYAPMEFSYHCTNRSWTYPKFNATTDDGIVFSALELPGFQVGDR